MIRLKALLHQPVPYNIDLFNAFARDPHFDLNVWWTRADGSHSNQFFGELPLREFSEQKLPSIAGSLPSPSAVVECLRRPTDLTLVAGYSTPVLALAVLWLSHARLPWVLWGDRWQNTWPINPAKRLAKRLLLHLTFKNALIVFASGNAGMASLMQIGCPTKKIGNLPYAVDRRRVCQDAEQNAQETSRPGVRFLFVGQLIRRKGVDILLQAFRRLLAFGEDAWLTIVGVGEESASLEDYVRRAQMQDRVQFLGFLNPSAQSKHFQRSAALVVPSRWDAFGVVILEAFCWGVPVVATSTCGAGADRIEHGTNGFLVAPEDPRALCDGMRRFCQDPELSARMRSACVRSADAWPPARSVALFRERLTPLIREIG